MVTLNIVDHSQIVRFVSSFILYDLLESSGLWQPRVSFYTPSLEFGYKNLAVSQHRIVKSMGEDSKVRANSGAMETGWPPVGVDWAELRLFLGYGLVLSGMRRKC